MPDLFLNTINMDTNNYPFGFSEYLIFQQSNLKSERLYAIRKVHIKRISRLEREYGSLNQIPSREIIECHELVYDEKEDKYILEPDKRVITPINRLEYQTYFDEVS